jgi:hypothetical protein
MSRGQTTLDFAIGVSVFLIVVAFVLAFVPGMVQPFQASTQQETAAADRLAEQLAGGMLVEDVSKPYLLDRECTVIFFESRQDGNDPAGDDAENVDGNGNGFSDPFDSGSFTGSCIFSDSPFTERLAIADSDFEIRISIVADLDTAAADNPDTGGDDATPEPLCIEQNGADNSLGNEDDNRIIEGDAPFVGGRECDVTGGDDDILLSIGETPPTDTSSVVVARRYVQIEGGFADGTNDATLVVEVW